jgi:site-specific DNA-methyltransferase (adenine-specific)
MEKIVLSETPLIQAFLCDNMDLMPTIKNNSVDLIYCDILYGTGRKFKDYQDLKPIKQDIENHYIPRINEMYRILKDTGSIYLQMDYKISHWIRRIMDDVFGYFNFRNEIIWHYRTGNVSEKQFQRKHDTIFFYSKSDSWKFHPQEIKEYYASIYGPQFKPSFKGRKSGKDEYGEFRISFIDDVWNLSAVFTLSNEHTGYPTQKPEKLLERIIKASSNNNDLVADFYMGSGTTAVVCKELNRNFIGCDINEMAINIAKSRFDKKFFKQKNINDFMETIK